MRKQIIHNTQIIQKIGEWNGAAFNQLKDVLCSSPALCSLAFYRSFILSTAASDYGVGAVLSQSGDDGLDYSTAYYSHIKGATLFHGKKKRMLGNQVGYPCFLSIPPKKAMFTAQTYNKTMQWLDHRKKTNSHLINGAYYPYSHSSLWMNTERARQTLMLTLFHRLSNTLTKQVWC